MKHRILTIFLILVLANSFALCGAYADSKASAANDSVKTLSSAKDSDNTMSEVEEKIAALSYKEAKALYEQGSYGFFKFMGTTSACKVLKNAPYSAYTSIGSSKDATSLENMKKSIAFLKECNELREKEGLKALRVTDYMMAIAQSNCNASATKMFHTGQYGAQENLAWGLADPFSVWYTKERARYVAGSRGSNVAHYKNLIRPYNITGFAVNQKGAYSNTASQTFAYSDLKGYSVSYYEERFNEYYNALKKRIKK